MLSDAKLMVSNPTRSSRCCHDSVNPCLAWARSPTMVNVPRALFSTRTGREPRYHMNMDERAEWTWLGEPLAPLKGYPGVMWERPKRKPPKGLEEAWDDLGLPES